MLAMRRFKQETLSRYDGTIYTDEETYDSYDISIECIVRDNFTVENLRRIKEVFKIGKGKLVFSHKPDLEYDVTLTNALRFEEMIKHVGGCILSFKVEPFSYLKSGKQEIKLSKGTNTITNLGNYKSFPIFRVEGASSNFYITINDKPMIFQISAESNVYIDIEREDVYGERGENYNSGMSLESDFVPLSEGKNSIKCEGSFNNIYITPNWREL